MLLLTAEMFEIHMAFLIFLIKSKNSNGGYIINHWKAKKGSNGSM